MATQYIKYAKKCEKKFFSQIIGGMASFGQGVATPMNVFELFSPKSGLWIKVAYANWKL